MKNKLVQDAEKTCRIAIKMPTHTDEQYTKMLEFIKEKENEACHTQKEHEIWRTAFVFFAEDYQ